jgi:hypothetical protein
MSGCLDTIYFIVKIKKNEEAKMKIHTLTCLKIAPEIQTQKD